MIQNGVNLSIDKLIKFIERFVNIEYCRTGKDFIDCNLIR